MVESIKMFVNTWPKSNTEHSTDLTTGLHEVGQLDKTREIHGGTDVSKAKKCPSDLIFLDILGGKSQGWW